MGFGLLFIIGSSIGLMFLKFFLSRTPIIIIAGLVLLAVTAHQNDPTIFENIPFLP